MFENKLIELNNFGPLQKVTKKVVLKVQDAMGNRCKLQMLPNQQMLKIRAKYSDKFDVEKNKVGLIYDGKAVFDTDTPISVDFKDGDIVCVYKKISEDIGSKEKASNLDERSLQSSSCNKAVANSVDYTSCFSKKSDLGLKSKSEISSNMHDSANDSFVDSSTSYSTDSTIEDDFNSVKDGNTLKSSKTLYYKINKNDDLARILTEFCKTRGLERDLVCFMYNGLEVFETDTAKSIGLKEGDNIDCFDRDFFNSQKVDQHPFQSCDQVELKDQTTSKQVCSKNMTEKKNILGLNTLSTSKNEICSTKSISKKAKKAEVKTCNESENSDNLKNIKSVNVKNQKSAISSSQLAEKKTVRTSMTTNINNSMERLFILYCRTKNIEKDHVFFSYGGRPIRDTDTPKSLGLKDGDVIQLKYRDTITDQKCLQSSDVKYKSLCLNPLVKENKTSEAVDEVKTSNFENRINESVLVGDSFAHLSTGDVDNTNSSNVLTNSRTLHFNIDKDNKLKKVMADFCKIRGLEKEMVRFIHNGREILETDTPESIGLKEGDNIDCFDRVPTNNFINKLLADKRDQIKHKSLVKTSPEKLSSQVAEFKNEIGDVCSKKKLVNNAPINHGFEKSENASVKNSLENCNSNDEPVVNNCNDNAYKLVNKSKSNVADSSEPMLLNKFASENENLKYKIKTSNTLKRLFMNYCRVKNLKRDNMSFQFKGREILDTDTPNSIGLKECDKIDVLEKNLAKINERGLEYSLSAEQPPKLDPRAAKTQKNSEEKKESSNSTQKVGTDVAAKPAVSKNSTPVYKKVDSKPVVDTLNRIVIRIYDESGDETSFNIRINQKLKKLLKKYCMMKDLHRNQVYFKYIGQEISDSDIPMSLTMKNDDIIYGYRWPTHQLPAKDRIIPTANSVESVSRNGLKCSNQRSPKLSKSSDHVTFHDLADKQTIENEIEGKPVFDPLYETVPSEISLKIINQKGKERKYRLNIRQKMKKLITKYCKKENMEKNCLCFRFGSEFVKFEDSPESLGIQDGDVIFAQNI